MPSVSSSSHHVPTTARSFRWILLLAVLLSTQAARSTLPASRSRPHQGVVSLSLSVHDHPLSHHPRAMKKDKDDEKDKDDKDNPSTPPTLAPVRVYVPPAVPDGGRTEDDDDDTAPPATPPEDTANNTNDTTNNNKDDTTNNKDDTTTTNDNNNDGPTTFAILPAVCATAASGGVYPTDRSLDLVYEYQVTVDAAAITTTTTTNTNDERDSVQSRALAAGEALHAVVTKDLVQRYILDPCDHSERRRLRRPPTHRVLALPAGTVQGVAPGDTLVLDDTPCDNNNNNNSDLQCVTLQSTHTVYLVPDDDASLSDDVVTADLRATIQTSLASDEALATAQASSPTVRGVAAAATTTTVEENSRRRRPVGTAVGILVGLALCAGLVYAGFLYAYPYLRDRYEARQVHSWQRQAWTEDKDHPEHQMFHDSDADTDELRYRDTASGSDDDIQRARMHGSNRSSSDSSDCSKEDDDNEHHTRDRAGPNHRERREKTTTPSRDRPAQPTSTTTRTTKAVAARFGGAWRTMRRTTKTHHHASLDAGRQPPSIQFTDTTADVVSATDAGLGCELILDDPFHHDNNSSSSSSSSGSNGRSHSNHFDDTVNVDEDDDTKDISEARRSLRPSFLGFGKGRLSSATPALASEGSPHSVQRFTPHTLPEAKERPLHMDIHNNNNSNNSSSSSHSSKKHNSRSLEGQQEKALDTSYGYSDFSFSDVNITINEHYTEDEPDNDVPQRSYKIADTVDL